MLDNYWPNKQQVSDCIRTEAEELSAHVLQVVHEPMHLRAFDISNGKSEFFFDNAELKLLDHLKIHSRPIPILGDAGSGKSHLIRLLDVQLENNPETKDWVVKRIPKSSSLRQVLEVLLEGMQGEVFDTLRKSINDVGDNLDTEEVADHLIVFMSHRLKELHVSTQERIEEIRRSGAEVSNEEKLNLKRIRQHAPLNKLPALLSDPNFKDRLIKPGRCLYNIAKRLTSGSEGEEINENDYRVTESDLELESVVTDDFSSKAKEYIRDHQLNSNEEKREEVVALLNEILSDACRIAFQRFFHFNGGQFQELFVDIRKELYGKTLVILVEDMAAITAIEKDLIDSLLLEGTREGEKTLCTVKSAIAVTTGYEGYQRRRSTIATRSGAIEWHIEKRSGNDAELYQRIENFCGRYLNAARYKLAGIVSNVEQGLTSLPPWQDASLDEISLDALDSFGRSDQDYPLFPYNKASLRALAELYCRNTLGDLEFNPRRILSHILKPILRDFRDSYLQGVFPPPNFLNLLPSSSLQSQIRIGDPAKAEQSLSAMSFWGYKASDKGMLVNLMPPSIASEMGMDELSQILGNTTPSPIGDPGVIPSGINPPTRPPPPSSPDPVNPIPTPPSATRFDEVDAAFRSKNIDQKLANIIRVELFEIIKSDLQQSKKWSGINVDISKSLRRGNRAPFIDIPFNRNRPDKVYASFGSEKILLDNIKSLKYKQFVVAILKKQDNNNVWDKSLYEDYCRYQNFSKEWADEVIPSVILQVQKENLVDHLKPAVKMASNLHPGFIELTKQGKFEILCSHSKSWKDDLASHTGQGDWDDYKNKLITEWDTTRNQWLNFVAINDHAVARDLFSDALKSVSSSGLSDKLAQDTQRRISAEYSEVFSPMVGCTDRVSFVDSFIAMRELIEEMNSNAQFSYPDNELTAKKVINKINKVISEEGVAKSWLSTSKLIKLLEPYTFDSFIKAINQFNSADVELVQDALQCWQRIYRFNLANYNAINLSNDSASRVVKEELLLSKLVESKDIVESLITSGECAEHGDN
ncbi:protein DpdH [Pseudomonadales bacterium]|nr:protein DpdH [Pseudomonadales bacterium]